MKCLLVFHWPELSNCLTARKTISFVRPPSVELGERGGIEGKCSISHSPTELVTAYSEW